MTTIVLRQDHPEGLSIAQIDANFSNLNNDKVEKTDDLYLGTTSIQYNRASGALSVSGFDIAKSGVRADGSPDGKYLRLVDGVSEWADVETGTNVTIADDTTTDLTFYPVFASSTGVASAVNISTSKLFYNPSTGVVNAVGFNSLSDISFKNNVIQISNAVSVINKLNGVEYDWKDTGAKSAGVIAQQLELVLPHLVNEVDGVKSVNYHGIVGYLIEAIKEQQIQIDMLNERVKGLENT